MGNRTLSSLERGELSLGDSPPYYADWEQRLRQITSADLAAAAAAVFISAQSATAVVAPEKTDGGADAMPAEGN